MKIRIWTKATGEVLAELSMVKNPRTVEKISRALPLKAAVSTWGKEVYFPINVKAKKENTSQTVEKGDIGYWPPGDSLCIFFGPIPASVGSEIRPARPVNVVGKLLGNPEVFSKAKDGDEIAIDNAE